MSDLSSSSSGSFVDDVSGLTEGGGWMSLLRSSSLENQRKALRLGALLLPDETLESMLRDDFDAVLRNAALDMVRMRGERGRQLAVRLVSDVDTDVALQAVQALDVLQRDSDFALLEKVAKQHDPNLAQAALIALGHSGHDGARAALRPFIQGDPWLQAAAIESLANLGDVSSVPLLEGLTSDPLVGSLALEAMGKIGGQQALDILCTAWLSDGGRGLESREYLAAIVQAAEGTQRPSSTNSQLGEDMMRRFHSAAGEERDLLARAIMALCGRVEPVVLEHFFAASGSGESPLPACFRRHPELAAILAQRAPEWALQLAADCGEQIEEEVFSTMVPDVLSHASAGPASALLVAALSRRNTLPAALESLLIDAVLAGNECGRSVFRGLLPRFASALHDAMQKRQAPPTAERALLLAALHRPSAEVAGALEELEFQLLPAAVLALSAWPAVLATLPWQRWISRDPSLIQLAARIARIMPLPGLGPFFRKELLRTPTPDLANAVASAFDIDSDDALSVGPGDASLALIEVLGKARGERSATLLRSLARDGSDIARRNMALSSLARRADAVDIPLFVSLVEDGDWLVRHACARALSRHASEPAARAALVILASDSAPLVSDCALTALENAR